MTLLSKEQMLTECRHRGIKPGARLRCSKTGKEGLAWPIDQWTRLNGCALIVGVTDDGESNIWAYPGYGSKWAEPINTD